MSDVQPDLRSIPVDAGSQGAAIFVELLDETEQEVRQVREQVLTRRSVRPSLDRPQDARPARPYSYD